MDKSNSTVSNLASGVYSNFDSLHIHLYIISERVACVPFCNVYVYIDINISYIGLLYAVCLMPFAYLANSLFLHICALQNKYTH